MNPFDQRWQTVARCARGAADDGCAEPPFGLATRVLARCRQVPEETWEELLAVLGLRALLVVTVLCLASGGYVYSEWRETCIETPLLEQELTAELSWP